MVQGKSLVLIPHSIGQATHERPAFPFHLMGMFGVLDAVGIRTRGSYAEGQWYVTAPPMVPQPGPWPSPFSPFPPRLAPCIPHASRAPAGNSVSLPTGLALLLVTHRLANLR